MKIQKKIYAGVNAVIENCILPSHFYEYLINGRVCLNSVFLLIRKGANLQQSREKKKKKAFHDF